MKWLAWCCVLCVGACIKERCYENSDCPRGKVCNAEGRCVYECVDDQDCGAGFECVGFKCRPAGGSTPIECPDDMVAVANAFCIDRYEASRPDATAASQGRDESRATSRKGVMPWLVGDNAAAQAACVAAGKRLCTPAEWETACSGPKGTTYAYGDEYDPKICNGIDTFGPGQFKLMPTGSFPDCKNDWGVYDMNGNVWEHVLGGDSRDVRGGAYNCSDSKLFQRCDYVPRTWTPSALGFRCCLRPSGQGAVEEGGAAEEVSRSEDVLVEQAPESGCISSDDGVNPSEAVGTDVSIDDNAANDILNNDIFAEGNVGPDHDSGPAACPADMVIIVWGNGQISCIDRYEASHADATAIAQGKSPVAASKKGVLPWFPVTFWEASDACIAAGKRLCKAEEWFDACRGPDKTIYSYGDKYMPTTCNSIDTFCNCDPYPHCYWDCGASFHVMPTGSFPECTNEWGVYDINGNVWELVDAGDGTEHFRGGAFNCSDSELLHRCDYDAPGGVSAKGFRCCKDIGD